MTSGGKVTCLAGNITLHSARNCSDVLQVPERKIRKEQNKMLLFCSKEWAGILLNPFSTSESWHTANVLLGAQQNSRHWHINISKLSRTRNHFPSLRPRGMARPPLHSIALGYRSFLGLMWYTAVKEIRLLFFIYFYKFRITGKNSTADSEITWYIHWWSAA